jgi:hypothetical protein
VTTTARPLHVSLTSLWRPPDTPQRAEVVISVDLVGSVDGHPARPLSRQHTLRSGSGHRPIGRTIPQLTATEARRTIEARPPYVNDDEETSMPDAPAMNEVLGSDTPKNPLAIR